MNEDEIEIILTFDDGKKVQNSNAWQLLTGDGRMMKSN